MKAVDAPITSFSGSFMYSIHQMHFLVQKHLDKTLSEAKMMSFSQFLVLMCFQECLAEKKQSQSNIAKYLHITEATVSRHIAKLIEEGFIRRVTEGPTDRSFILRLTPKGTKSFGKARELIERELSSLFSVIKESDRKNIIDNFTTVLHTLLEINK